MLKFKKPFEKLISVRYFVIHHLKAKKASKYDVHRWHLKKGWNGIGYHRLVRKSTAIEEGRPLWAAGAHCKGFNYHSLGIACEGNFEMELMNSSQRKALINELFELKKLHPQAIIVGHGWLNDSACPGFSDAEVCSIAQEVEAKYIKYKSSMLQRMIDRFGKILKRRGRR